MTRWFFDTEFIDTGKSIDLISIGIISEDGLRSYSACLRADERHGWAMDDLEPWHIEHVLLHLPPPDQRKPALQVAQEILRLTEEDQPEFWAYFASYDWVALCQLVTGGGRLIDLPPSWPRFVCDLKLLMHLNHLSKRDLPVQPEDEAHDALADARWVRSAYLHIMKLQPVRPTSVIHATSMLGTCGKCGRKIHLGNCDGTWPAEYHIKDGNAPCPVCGTQEPGIHHPKEGNLCEVTPWDSLPESWR